MSWVGLFVTCLVFPEEFLPEEVEELVDGCLMGGGGQQVFEGVERVGGDVEVGQVEEGVEEGPEESLVLVEEDVADGCLVSEGFSQDGSGVQGDLRVEVGGDERVE